MFGLRHEFLFSFRSFKGFLGTRTAHTTPSIFTYYNYVKRTIRFGASMHLLGVSLIYTATLEELFPKTLYFGSENRLFQLMFSQVSRHSKVQ